MSAEATEGRAPPGPVSRPQLAAPAASAGFAGFACLDFSARSTPSPRKPSADACWWRLGDETGRGETGYERTRARAWAAIAHWARGRAARGPLLLGVDVALGFPAGTAAALGVGGWRGLWALLAAEVIDHPETNANNRWEVAARLNALVGAGPGGGPWWGCPPAKASAFLCTRRGFDWPVNAAGGQPLPRLRATDAACPGVQEVWKLQGAGSVGSQSLLGIAGLVRLRDQLAGAGVRLRVWPFERASPPVPGELWVAECWPAGLELAEAKGGEIRDAQQVEAWVSWAVAHAGTAWSRPLPAAADEEGWILGD